MAPVKTKPVKKAIKSSKKCRREEIGNEKSTNPATTKRQTVKVLTPQIGFSVEAFEALLTSRPFEPEWMRDRRRDAFHVLLDTPLPTRNDEAWRRTDFGALNLNEVETVLPKTDEPRP